MVSLEGWVENSNFPQEKIQRKILAGAECVTPFSSKTPILIGKKPESSTAVWFLSVYAVQHCGGNLSFFSYFSLSSVFLQASNLSLARLLIYLFKDFFFFLNEPGLKTI